MAGIWRCAFHSTHVTGVEFVNTFHVVVHDSALVLGNPSAVAVRDVLDSALTTKYNALLPANVTLNTLTVREELAPGSTAVPEEASKTIGTAGVRVTSGDLLPIPTCVLVTFYTNAGVRSGHGRMFIPNPGQAGDLDGSGHWDAASLYWAAIKTFCDELGAPHGAGLFGTDFTAKQVIYSRTRRLRGDAAYWFDVTSYVRRQSPHWLRSRLTAP